MNVLTRTVSTMQLQTKLLRLRTPVSIGSRFGDWKVTWLGGWTRCRLSYLVMVVESPMTNLKRRLRRLEALLRDPSGLVPYSEKWLDYWQGWLDRRADDPTFRPPERMPLEAARAIIRRAPCYEES